MKRCYANYYRQLDNNTIVTMLEYNKVLIIELNTCKELTRKMNSDYFSYKGNKYTFTKLQSIKGTKKLCDHFKGRPLRNFRIKNKSRA